MRISICMYNIKQDWLQNVQYIVPWHGIAFSPWIIHSAWCSLGCICYYSGKFVKLYLSVFAAIDPSKLDVNRDLTTGVLKIRTKKETIKGKRDCKGTLDRLLALFFQLLSIKLHWVCLRIRQKGEGRGEPADSTARPITKQNSVIQARQQSSATPLLWIRGECWQWYHTYPIQLKSPESYSSLRSFRHCICKIERQGQFFVP